MLDRLKMRARLIFVFLSANQGRLATRWIVLLALVATLFLAAVMDMALGVYDESLILQGAVEMSRGALPHRDFFSPYGPMQFWIVSKLFDAFGREMLVARLYDVVVRGSIILVCGLVVRRLDLRPALVIGAMVVETLLLYAAGFYLYPVFPSLLCALLGTFILFSRNPGHARIVAAGALTGLTAIIRYDIGFFLLAAHLLTLTLLWLRLGERLSDLILKAGLYGLGVALFFLPVAVGGWAEGALPGFVHDIIWFAPTNYARMRGLPWPVPTTSISSLLPLIAYVPFLTTAVGLAWLVYRRRSAAGPAISEYPSRLATALLVLVALFCLKGVVRLSLIHSLLALVPAVLLLAYLLGQREPRAIRLSAASVLALTLPLLAVNAAAPLKWAASHRFDTWLAVRAIGRPVHPERSVGCPPLPTLGIGSVDTDTYAAACYIAAHTSPGDAIFVGAGRHDRLFVGNAAVYFASDRTPGTHWYHLEPGLQTRRDVQEEVARDLDATGVRYIAIERRYDINSEPNDSAKSTGVRVLDRFIAAKFARVATFGGIDVLRRRSQFFRGDETPVARGRALTHGGDRHQGQQGSMREARF